MPSKVISPSKLAHIVLRTNADNFKTMANFYKTFLGGEATYENEFLSFITYDDEHHRVAIAGVPGTGPKTFKTSGLEHIAFTFDTLDDLAKAYSQRKQHNIFPIWSVNHGPTTSIYYADPDGNQIETQVDNFDNVKDASTFMASSEFAENPIGVDFDPEDLIKRLHSGEDVAAIRKRPNIGPRYIPLDA
jgi:catechol-2,3-dioxygenase